MCGQYSRFSARRMSPELSSEADSHDAPPKGSRRKSPRKAQKLPSGDEEEDEEEEEEGAVWFADMSFMRTRRYPPARRAMKATRSRTAHQCHALRRHCFRCCLSLSGGGSRRRS